MAITKAMRAVVGPLNGQFDAASPSTLFTDTDIYFPSLEASPDTPEGLGSGYSKFLYRNTGGGFSMCCVKATVANISGGFSVGAAIS